MILNVNTTVMKPSHSHLFLLLALAMPLLVACSTSHDDYPIDKSLYEQLPFDMEVVRQPSFPTYSVSIADFGAVSDGHSLCHEAINKAIDHVSAKGGGHVIIPSGLWLCGPIELKSNVDLHTEHGAIIYFCEDHSLYPIIETSFEGLETRRCTSPISAWHCENIAITGHGVFDGNGDTWRAVKKDKMSESQWKSLLKKGGVLEGTTWYPSEGSIKGKNACLEFNNPVGIETEEDWNSIRDWLRPVLLNFVYCKTVLLEGCTFKNSPAWCLHPRSCDHITLDGVTVINPWYSQNGDALDLESCTNALIANCLFDKNYGGYGSGQNPIHAYLPQAGSTTTNEIGWAFVGSTNFVEHVMNFRVPAAAREVLVNLCPQEAGSARLLDASGKVVDESPFVRTAKVLKAARQPSAADEVWSLVFPKIEEDYYFQVGGDAVPLLSTERESVIVGK